MRPLTFPNSKSAITKVYRLPPATSMTLTVFAGLDFVALQQLASRLLVVPVTGRVSFLQTTVHYSCSCNPVTESK